MKHRLLILLLIALFTTAGTLPVRAQVQAQEGTVHIVQPGETLYSLSRHYGIPVPQIAAANGLSTDAWLYIGQRIIIPGTAAAPTAPPAGNPTYVVQAGDTLNTVALRHGVTAAALAAANRLPLTGWLYIGQVLILPTAQSTPATPSTPPASPPASDSVYTVQPGDTLSAIAYRTGTTVAALQAANGLLNPNRIYVGQRLRLSSAGTPPPATAPVATPPPGAAGERWIDVNLSTQTLTAYEGATPVFTTRVSTGLPQTPTVVGTYSIYVKYAATDMSGPGYYLPNVPYTMYFYRGYGIHGTYWHNNFGAPMSHGCVNMSTPDAEWLFNWAAVGTPVVTHY